MSRLSHRFATAAFTAVASLAVGLLAAAGGESPLAVSLATLAGVVAVVQTVRARRGTDPSTAGQLAVAVLCGLGALASIPGEQWFTAATLAGLGLMNFGTGVGWRVAEGRPEGGP